MIVPKMLLVSFINTFIILCVHADQAEYRLHADLMQNYNPLERPVKNFNDTLIVKMKVILQQIVGLVSDICIHI
jgi:hypothetical protein